MLSALTSIFKGKMKQDEEKQELYYQRVRSQYKSVCEDIKETVRRMKSENQLAIEKQDKLLLELNERTPEINEELKLPYMTEKEFLESAILKSLSNEYSTKVKEFLAKNPKMSHSFSMLIDENTEHELQKLFDLFQKYVGNHRQLETYNESVLKLKENFDMVDFTLDSTELMSFILTNCEKVWDSLASFNPQYYFPFRKIIDEYTNIFDNTLRPYFLLNRHMNGIAGHESVIREYQANFETTYLQYMESFDQPYRIHDIGNLTSTYEPDLVYASKVNNHPLISLLLNRIFGLSSIRPQKRIGYKLGAYNSSQSSTNKVEKETLISSSYVDSLLPNDELFQFTEHNNKELPSFEDVKVKSISIFATRNPIRFWCYMCDPYYAPMLYHDAVVSFYIQKTFHDNPICRNFQYCYYIFFCGYDPDKSKICRKPYSLSSFVIKEPFHEDKCSLANIYLKKISVMKMQARVVHVLHFFVTVLETLISIRKRVNLFVLGKCDIFNIWLKHKEIVNIDVIKKRKGVTILEVVFSNLSCSYLYNQEVKGRKLVEGESFKTTELKPIPYNTKKINTPVDQITKVKYSTYFIDGVNSTYAALAAWYDILTLLFSLGLNDATSDLFKPFTDIPAISNWYYDEMKKGFDVSGETCLHWLHNQSLTEFDDTHFSKLNLGKYVDTCKDLLSQAIKKI